MTVVHEDSVFLDECTGETQLPYYQYTLAHLHRHKWKK